MNFLGIEIGGTKLQLVRGEGNGRIHQRCTLPVVPAAGAAGIRVQITQAVAELVRARPVTAVGVGFGGPVDWQTGRICRSHQIEGWSEFDLGGWLHAQTGAPVFVDNDANVAAYGEAVHGAGVGFDSVAYVTLGSGVGGGLIVGGRIYHGAKPGESEVGHLRLDRAGTTVESRCSGWAVDARIRKLVTDEPAGALAKLVDPLPGGEAKHLAAALQQGDPGAQRLLAAVAEDLAFGLSHVVHLFHPHVIVLGGGLAGVGEPLRAAVEQALRRDIMEAFVPGLALRLSKLGGDVVPLGALCLAQARLNEQGRPA